MAVADDQGVFGAPRGHAAGELGVGLVAADLDLDGALDAVVLDAGLAALFTLRGQGDGGLDAAFTVGTCVGPTRLTAGNVVGDERPDVLVTCPAATQVALHTGTGDLESGLTRAGPQNVHGGDATTAVTVADLDADGFGDVLLSISGPKRIRVLYGAGNGAFAPPVDIPVTFTARALVVGDLSGEGAPELAAAQSSWVSILRGRRVGCPP